MQHQLTRRATLAAAASAALLSNGAIAQTKSRIGIIGAGNIGASIGEACGQIQGGPSRDVLLA